MSSYNNNNNLYTNSFKFQHKPFQRDTEFNSMAAHNFKNENFFELVSKSAIKKLSKRSISIKR